MSENGQKIIAGNWKMNGNVQQAVQFGDALLEAGLETEHEIIICPPLTLLPILADIFADSDFFIGAQDCSERDKGAYTGDVSADMLVESGADFVIIGHSERRQLHGENDALVRAKAEAAIKAGLVPIICVGETKEQRDGGHAENIVQSQLTGSLPADGDYLIAYEPVWAIGTGVVASNADIEAMHSFIRQRTDKPLLYGGSVKPDNAREIMRIDNVDGVLVGGASLKAEDFLAIIAAAG